jgi:hypothetical protein
MTAITLRFVTSDNAISNLIRAQAGVCMPFTPSHVEAFTRDGKHYVGQHMDGGMQARPIGYDAGETNVQEKFVQLPCTEAQFDAFHGFCTKHLGDPYDWRAIISFADPALNFHGTDESICSAIMTLALRACDYFQAALVVPAHHISPRDLFLILSTHVEIKH